MRGKDGTTISMTGGEGGTAGDEGGTDPATSRLIVEQLCNVLGFSITMQVGVEPQIPSQASNFVDSKRAAESVGVVSRLMDIKLKYPLDAVIAESIHNSSVLARSESVEQVHNVATAYNLGLSCKGMFASNMFKAISTHQSSYASNVCSGHQTDANDVLVKSDKNLASITPNVTSGLNIQEQTLSTTPRTSAAGFFLLLSLNMQDGSIVGAAEGRGEFRG
ncbi:hypothetical protein EV714DRAFT_276515 [Schizophyllum commune]